MKLRHRACGKVAATFTTTTAGIRVELARGVLHDKTGQPLARTYWAPDVYNQTYPSPVDHYFDLLEAPDNLEVECLRCHPPELLSVPWGIIHKSLQAGGDVLKWPPST